MRPFPGIAQSDILVIFLHLNHVLLNEPNIQWLFIVYNVFESGIMLFLYLKRLPVFNFKLGVSFQQCNFFLTLTTDGSNISMFKNTFYT